MILFTVYEFFDYKNKYLMQMQSNNAIISIPLLNVPINGINPFPSIHGMERYLRIVYG